MKKRKRLLVLLLTAAMLLCAVPFAASAAAYGLGDVDGNGRIAPEDARLALRASVGLEQIQKDSEAFAAADVNYSGAIEPEDARLILRASVGLEFLKQQDGKNVVTLTADKTTVRPGDTVTLTLHLKDCPKVACFNFSIRCMGPASVAGNRFNKFSNKNGDAFTINSNAKDKELLLGGMISTTCDFLDDDLCTVTYRVSADAEPGEELIFAALTTQFMTSETEDGRILTDYSEEINAVMLRITVA